MTIPIKTDILFGIPLGTTEIPIEICQELKNLPSTNQEDETLYEDRPDLYNVLQYNVKLKKTITEIFSLWLRNLTGDTAQKWVMTTNWVTQNSNGREMTAHSHTNCLYSAVLYFDDLEEEHPPLELRNPLCLNMSMGINADFNNPTPFFSYKFECPISTGLMLMFPSYLTHGHPAFKSKKSRRSFACNFFPIGRYGYADSTLDTNWLQYDD